MKATGIIRRVDDLGRIVVPKEIRETHGMQEGTPVEFFVEGEHIIIKTYKPGCVLCGEMENIKTIDGKEHSIKLCTECLSKITRG